MTDPLAPPPPSCPRTRRSNKGKLGAFASPKLKWLDFGSRDRGAAWWDNHIDDDDDDDDEAYLARLRREVRATGKVEAG